jgi:hypothetical protein
MTPFEVLFRYYFRRGIAWPALVLATLAPVLFLARSGIVENPEWAVAASSGIFFVTAAVLALAVCLPAIGEHQHFFDLFSASETVDRAALWAILTKGFASESLSMVAIAAALGAWKALPAALSVSLFSVASLAFFLSRKNTLPAFGNALLLGANVLIVVGFMAVLVFTAVTGSSNTEVAVVIASAAAAGLGVVLWLALRQATGTREKKAGVLRQTWRILRICGTKHSFLLTTLFLLLLGSLLNILPSLILGRDRQRSMIWFLVPVLFLCQTLMTFSRTAHSIGIHTSFQRAAFHVLVLPFAFMALVCVSLAGVSGIFAGNFGGRSIQSEAFLMVVKFSLYSIGAFVILVAVFPPWRRIYHWITRIDATWIFVFVSLLWIGAVVLTTWIDLQKQLMRRTATEFSHHLEFIRSPWGYVLHYAHTYWWLWVALCAIACVFLYCAALRGFLMTDIASGWTPRVWRKHEEGGR